MSQILPKDSYSTFFFYSEEMWFLKKKKKKKTLQIYYLSNQYIFVDYFYFFCVRK